MWDKRYSVDDYVYGKAPNHFLYSFIDKLPRWPLGQRALCLADGEGRNSVFLAQQGYQVTAVDISSVGLAKAKRLGLERNVEITTVQSDIADYQIEEGHWDLIVLIFAHMPAELRKTIHQRCVKGLRSGGMIVLESYTPKQLEFGTGGPKDSNLLVTAEQLKQEFGGLELITLEEQIREIREGILHTGQASVVDLWGKVPQTDVA